MVKCEVIVDFYDNVESKARKKGEEFECLEERAEYLSGKNKLKLKVVDVIEVIPENVSRETKEEQKEEKKKTTRKRKLTE